MFKSTLLAVLAVATGAYAQFALQITEPANNEFVQLGASHSITIQADVPAGTASPDVQLSLCQVISGFTPCNGTAGRVILTAPFAPPQQTYDVLIPADQAPGTTLLIAEHITGSILTDKTSIQVFLGSSA